MSTFVHNHITCYVCTVIIASPEPVQNKNAMHVFDTDADWADAIVAAFFPAPAPQPTPQENASSTSELETV
jgi:hypothetical protein